MVECLDGPARITSKELALIHSVKSGTLQNACSTRPRVVVGLGKSAHTHIVRLMNSPAKGLKRMMTKSAVAMSKKNEWHENVWKLVSTHEEMKVHEEDRFLRGRQIAFLMAREMVSPRQVKNRRRRSRESPEPACAHTLFAIWGGTHRGATMNQHFAVVPSRRGKNFE